jgi:hypothetical protein
MKSQPKREILGFEIDFGPARQSDQSKALSDAMRELKRAVVNLGVKGGRPGLQMARKIFEVTPELRRT